MFTVKHLGWTVGALTTPVLMGGLAAPFFLYVITQDVSKNKQALMTAVWVRFKIVHTLFFAHFQKKK